MNQHLALLAALLLTLVSLSAKAVLAQDAEGCATINFEFIPGTAPADFLKIDTQFEDALGITFALEDGEPAELAKVGGVTSAFEPNDTPNPGQGIGTFFLTDDGILASVAEPSPLIITFSLPVDSTSGIVLDIDFNETFTIQARDASQNVLEEIVISAGDDGTGDGVATTWGFRRSTADIVSLRFQGVRPSGRFGLGFDNFTTCAPDRELPPAVCTPLDFESVPGETAVEGLVIDTQFEAGFGVAFALEDGESPRLAEVGEPTTAFEPNDTPDADQGIGTFFLTDDGVLQSEVAPPPLIVSYTAPVDSASGVVLDIDFSETFTIQARDAAENVLEEIVISAGDEGTGNGNATPWGFRRAMPDVASIRFVGFRSSGRFGLGFDNFVACTTNPFATPLESAGTEATVALHPNYPNPFAHTTAIRYVLADGGPVRLVVYDMLGRNVATLVDQIQPPGTHTVTFDASKLASGVYLYRIESGGYAETGKMLLSR